MPPSATLRSIWYRPCVPMRSADFSYLARQGVCKPRKVIPAATVKRGLAAAAAAAGVHTHDVAIVLRACIYP
jgi:hypothetical protein